MYDFPDLENTCNTFSAEGVTVENCLELADIALELGHEEVNFFFIHVP